jgi:hypothetical protein
VGREVAHLVAALADVPRLGDELDGPDDGVLLDDVEEGREPVDLMSSRARIEARSKRKPSTCISLVQ